MPSTLTPFSEKYKSLRDGSVTAAYVILMADIKTMLSTRDETSRIQDELLYQLAHKLQHDFVNHEMSIITLLADLQTFLKTFPADLCTKGSYIYFLRQLFF